MAFKLNITKFVLLLFFSVNASAIEFTLDLGLYDKKLNYYHYAPTIQDYTHSSMRIDGVERSYYAYFPENVSTSMNVLVALHGHGRTGLSMIDTWKSVADEYSFIVIGPDAIDKEWKKTRDEAPFISAIVERELSKRHIAIDNYYLFGHSNGAIQAIAQAVIHPGMFRRVAAHAGTLPLAKNTFKKEQPMGGTVALFLGDSDHIFSVKSGRKTIRWLSSIGINAGLYVLKDHSHWYYEQATLINQRIWAFLDQL